MGGHLREKGEGHFPDFPCKENEEKEKRERNERKKNRKRIEKTKMGGGAGEGAKSFPIKPTGSRRQRRSISHYSLWVTKIGF